MLLKQIAKELVEYWVMAKWLWVMAILLVFGWLLLVTVLVIVGA